MSGLSHTPGKRARGKTLRGFESRLLRQIVMQEKICIDLDVNIYPHPAKKLVRASQSSGPTSNQSH